jgi:hypothetical protein
MSAAWLIRIKDMMMTKYTSVGEKVQVVGEQIYRHVFVWDRVAVLHKSQDPHENGEILMHVEHVLHTHTRLVIIKRPEARVTCISYHVCSSRRRSVTACRRTSEAIGLR